MTTAVDDKGERLLRIFQLMQEAPPLLFEADRLKAAGRIDTAEQTLARLAATLERQFEETLEHDRLFPETPFGAGSVLEQLLDALLTRADLLETLRHREEAETLRETAIALARSHEQAPQLAERQRQRAAAFLSQARYHEAAGALAAARDEFTRLGQTLSTAHVAVDLAELYEWLGDLGRAKEEAARTRQVIEPLLGAAAPSFADAFTAIAAGKFEEAQASAELHGYLVRTDATRGRGWLARWATTTPLLPCSSWFGRGSTRGWRRRSTFDWREPRSSGGV